MNRMTALLNKLERRLGTKAINLPEELQKDKWADEVIANETLDTFSRYFPHAITYVINPQTTPRKNGWYLIDEEVCESVEIIGVKDIDWNIFSRDGLYQGHGYGIYDHLTYQYGVDDVALFQGRSDLVSMFNNNIIVEFKEPNMLHLMNVTGGDITRGFRNIPITLFVKHPKNLMTISQTMMETFEELALCDVASFLYESLKLYDGFETVYASIDLKMSDWADKASKREDVVNKLDESHVSASNQNQPIMFTV